MSLQHLQFSPSEDKEGVKIKIRQELANYGFKITAEDFKRPWGGFFKINDKQNKLFINTFFKGINIPGEILKLYLSPKILAVEPGKRLSWQYHSRRGEFWRIIHGPVGVFLGNNDHLPQHYQTYQVGETANIKPGTRHRVLGLDNWGMWAELWVHLDKNNLSEESDIIRVSDDFGR